MVELYNKKALQIVKELGSDHESGISIQEATDRLAKNGKNIFSPPKKESIFIKIFDNFKQPLILILIISALISLLMRHIVDGLGIIVAVVISTIIAIIQEGRSEKAFEALAQQSEDINVKVLRDGRIVYLNKSYLTIGDILHLEMGDKVPADVRVITSLQLKVDESMLTGESEAVSKNGVAIEKIDVPLAERSNMLYAGTLLVDGRATVIVTAIGDDTEMGKIAKELKDAEVTDTPLQQKLAALGKKISVIGAIAAGAIFVFELYNAYTKMGSVSVENVKEAFIRSVALIVAAVPEGLPTMVALTLAINMRKMARNNALVRKMIACETIGSINVICSDKTGTLTQNKMSVVDIWRNGEKVQIENIDSDELIQNFCLNSTADIDDEAGAYNFIGNPTEGALLACSVKNGINYKKIRYDFGEPVQQYQFTSDRKMMSTAFHFNDKYKLYSKGSPEKILMRCNKVTIKGNVVELDDKLKEEISRKVKVLQDDAKRVIAFAYREMEYEPEWKNDFEVENGLTFVGFVGIEDPLRPEVKEAINKCRKAGIAVKILTGDHINTATAIAKQLDIIEKDSYILEVSEIEKMSDEELTKILDKLVVLARSNPESKMRIVKLLKQKNDAVVVTGDGINDAPALKNADVGVSMGIAGTEVSKAASDIVLLDDSFSTIVKAVKWGRAIYENFQRFIQFQLTVNVVAFVTALMSEILGFGMPFTTLQLLWVNIIMDGPPALSLGLEPPRENLLNKNPIPRMASIVTKDMLFRILSNGLFIVTALLFLIKYNILGATIEQQSTVVFTSFVLFQVWNAFNCRELGTISLFKNVFQNKAMLYIVALTFLMQVIIVHFGGVVFKTVGLDLNMWAKIVMYTFSVIVFNEIIKLACFVGKRLKLKFA